MIAHSVRVHRQIVKCQDLLVQLARTDLGDVRIYFVFFDNGAWCEQNCEIGNSPSSRVTGGLYDADLSNGGMTCGKNGLKSAPSVRQRHDQADDQSCLREYLSPSIKKAVLGSSSVETLFWITIMIWASLTASTAKVLHQHNHMPRLPRTALPTASPASQQDPRQADLQLASHRGALHRSTNKLAM